MAAGLISRPIPDEKGPRPPEPARTSTAYLDPARSDNLQYLMHGRDWDTVVDHYATPPGGTTTGMPLMAEDGDGRKGFGAALEAAATGHPPLAAGQDPWPEARHNAAQTRVLAGVIDQLKPRIPPVTCCTHGNRS